MPIELFQKLRSSYEWVAPLKLIPRLKMALLDSRLYQLTHEASELEIENIIEEINWKTHIFSKKIAYADWYKSASLIFTSQYAAGYYGYLWAEVVASDIFFILSKGGAINRKVGEIFRKNILSPGGLLDLSNATKTICKRQISTDAFFHYRHLI